MALLVGTSGFAFKEWKGPFYPEKCKDVEMLPAYAARLPTVELNNTFYRMPQEKSFLDWAAKVPESFRFSVKANQRITHHAQLLDVGELVGHLVQAVSALGERLGPTLFQLPPFLKRDLPRLEAFLDVLPRNFRAAIEFRHPSWLDDEKTFELLRSRGVTLCISDLEKSRTPLVATTDWGYLRLHRFDYDDAALTEWAERVRTLPWKEGVVYFKHDLTPGSGPLLAEAFIAKLG